MAVDIIPGLLRTNQTWFDVNGGTISKNEFIENCENEMDFPSFDEKSNAIYTAKNSTSWSNNAVTTRLSWLNNVVQRTMLFTIVSTMLFSIDEATTVFHLKQEKTI